VNVIFATPLLVLYGESLLNYTEGHASGFTAGGGRASRGGGPDDPRRYLRQRVRDARSLGLMHDQIWLSRSVPLGLSDKHVVSLVAYRLRVIRSERVVKSDQAT
jgi:hypothetical protein